MLSTMRRLHGSYDDQLDFTNILEDVSMLMLEIADFEYSVEIIKQGLLQLDGFDPNHIFWRLDLRKASKIHHNDLRIFMEENNTLLTSKETSLLFASLDKDKDGFLDLKEFMRFILPKETPLDDCAKKAFERSRTGIRIAKIPLEVERRVMELLLVELQGLKSIEERKFSIGTTPGFDSRLVFEEIDQSNRGFLETRDIYDFLTDFVDSITFRKTERIVRRITTNRNNRIACEDFAEMLTVRKIDAGTRFKRRGRFLYTGNGVGIAPPAGGSSTPVTGGGASARVSETLAGGCEIQKLRRSGLLGLSAAQRQDIGKGSVEAKRICPGLDFSKSRLVAKDVGTTSSGRPSFDTKMRLSQVRKSFEPREEEPRSGAFRRRNNAPEASQYHEKRHQKGAGRDWGCLDSASRHLPRNGSLGTAGARFRDPFQLGQQHNKENLPLRHSAFPQPQRAHPEQDRVGDNKHSIRFRQEVAEERKRQHDDLLLRKRLKTHQNSRYGLRGPSPHEEAYNRQPRFPYPLKDSRKSSGNDQSRSIDHSSRGLKSDRIEHKKSSHGQEGIFQAGSRMRHSMSFAGSLHTAAHERSLLPSGREDSRSPYNHYKEKMQRGSSQSRIRPKNELNGRSRLERVSSQQFRPLHHQTLTDLHRSSFQQPVGLHQPVYLKEKGRSRSQTLLPKNSLVARSRGRNGAYQQSAAAREPSRGRGGIEQTGFMVNEAVGERNFLRRRRSSRALVNEFIEEYRIKSRQKRTSGGHIGALDLDCGSGKPYSFRLRKKESDGVLGNSGVIEDPYHEHYGYKEPQVGSGYHGGSKIIQNRKNGKKQAPIYETIPEHSTEESNIVDSSTGGRDASRTRKFGQKYQPQDHSRSPKNAIHCARQLKRVPSSLRMDPSSSQTITDPDYQLVKKQLPGGHNYPTKHPLDHRVDLQRRYNPLEDDTEDDETLTTTCAQNSISPLKSYKNGTRKTIKHTQSQNPFCQKAAQLHDVSKNLSVSNNQNSIQEIHRIQPTRSQPHPYENRTLNPSQSSNMLRETSCFFYEADSMDKQPAVESTKGFIKATSGSYCAVKGNQTAHTQSLELQHSQKSFNTHFSQTNYEPKVRNFGKRRLPEGAELAIEHSEEGGSEEMSSEVSTDKLSGDTFSPSLNKRCNTFVQDRITEESPQEDTTEEEAGGRKGDFSSSTTMESPVEGEQVNTSNLGNKRNHFKSREVINQKGTAPQAQVATTTTSNGRYRRATNTRTGNMVSSSSTSQFFGTSKGNMQGNGAPGGYMHTRQAQGFNNGKPTQREQEKEAMTTRFSNVLTRTQFETRDSTHRKYFENLNNPSDELKKSHLYENPYKNGTFDKDSDPEETGISTLDMAAPRNSNVGRSNVNSRDLGNNTRVTPKTATTTNTTNHRDENDKEGQRMTQSRYLNRQISTPLLGSCFVRSSLNLQNMHSMGAKDHQRTGLSPSNNPGYDNMGYNAEKRSPRNKVNSINLKQSYIREMKQSKTLLPLSSSRFSNQGGGPYQRTQTLKDLRAPLRSGEGHSSKQRAQGSTVYSSQVASKQSRGVDNSRSNRKAQKRPRGKIHHLEAKYSTPHVQRNSPVRRRTYTTEEPQDFAYISPHKPLLVKKKSSHVLLDPVPIMERNPAQFAKRSPGHVSSSGNGSKSNQSGQNAQNAQKPIPVFGEQNRIPGFLDNSTRSPQTSLKHIPQVETTTPPSRHLFPTRPENLKNSSSQVNQLHRNPSSHLLSKSQASQPSIHSRITPASPSKPSTKTEKNAEIETDDSEEGLVNCLKELIRDFRQIEEVRICLSKRLDFTIEEFYKLVDMGLTGLVSHHDLMDVLRLLKIEATLEDALLLINRFDKDRDGYLKAEEFVDLVAPFSDEFRESLISRKPRGVRTFKDYSERTKEILRQVLEVAIMNEKNADYQREVVRRKKDVLFELMDKQGRGSVSLEDLGDLLAEHGFGTTHRELNAIIQKFDFKKDGRISYGEFVAELTPKRYKAPVKKLR